jgi:GntR family transcriptional regulator
MDDSDEWNDLTRRDDEGCEGGQMTTPLYRGIAEQLRLRIESGEFDEADETEGSERAAGQLPTEQTLQKYYGASRNTVREAIKQLTTLGLVETKPGQGTFVTAKIDAFVTTLTGSPEEGGGEGASYASEVEQNDREPASSPVRVEIQEAGPDVASGLWIPVGTEVISRHQQRYIDQTPYSLQTSFYPGEFADRGAKDLRRARDIQPGTVSYLQETIGVKQVGYRDWITVRAPNQIEADFFKLPPDGRIVIYEIFRTAFDGNGRPMRLTITVYPADRNQFIVEVGAVPPPQPSQKQ